MNRKIYVNGLGLAHPTGSLDEFVGAFSGNAPSENAPRSALKDLLPGANLRRVPRAARMALEAAALALRDACMPTRFDCAAAPRAGVFTGAAHCCVEASFDFMDSIVDFGPKLSSPTAFSLSVNNVFTGMISLYTNTLGPSYTSCQFGVSFAGALAAATGSLLTGGCDVALVGAVEEYSPLLGAVYSLGLGSNSASGGVGEPVAGNGIAGWELPAVECAVFFVLSMEKGESGVEIGMPVWARALSGGADLLFSVISDRAATERFSCVLDCRALHGGGPAMQALDTALACSALRHRLLPAPAWLGSGVLPAIRPGAPESAVCECYSFLTGSYSAICLRRS